MLGAEAEATLEQCCSRISEVKRSLVQVLHHHQATVAILPQCCEALTHVHVHNEFIICVEHAS